MGREHAHLSVLVRVVLGWCGLGMLIVVVMSVGISIVIVQGVSNVGRTS